MREGNAEIRQLEQALELARAEARVEELENAPVSAAKSSQQPASKQDAVASPAPQSVEPSFWDSPHGQGVLTGIIVYVLLQLLVIF